MPTLSRKPQKPDVILMTDVCQYLARTCQSLSKAAKADVQCNPQLFCLRAGSDGPMLPLRLQSAVGRRTLGGFFG